MDMVSLRFGILVLFFLIPHVVSYHLDEVGKVVTMLTSKLKQQEKVNKELIERIQYLENQVNEKCETDIRNLKQDMQNLKDNKQDSKDKRLLLGSTPLPNHVTSAFYADLSHHENKAGSHHTFIFDEVKLNYGGHYDHFTGVYTVPVTGIYGFTYSIRTGGSVSDTIEIIRNAAVEGAVFIHEDRLQETVTGNAVIHAIKGDKIFIRSQPVTRFTGIVLSDVWGRSSFAGWLIFEE